MKFLVLALFLLQITAAHAETDPNNPRNELCNKKPTLTKIQRAVMEELREKNAEINPDSGAYSFLFTIVFRTESASDLTVYFEQTDGPFNPRYPYVAQYAVDPVTCAPEFKKLQLMTSDASPPPALGNGADRCNGPEYFPAIKTEVKSMLTDLYGQILPYATVENYSFSEIQRVPGTGDLVAFFETRTPGIASRPNVTEFSVDPVTCKASYRKSTVFTWNYVTE